MKKIPYFFLVFLFVSALMSNGCGTLPPEDLATQKITVLSSKDLQDKNALPNEVFYSDSFQKLAIIFRSRDFKKAVAFYDFSNGKLEPFFETPYAKEVFKPYFGDNLHAVYALLSGSIWKVFLLTLTPEAISNDILSVESLNGIAFDNVKKSIYVSAKRDGKPGIFQEPAQEIFQETSYKVIENLTWANGLVFSALKNDESWVVYSKNREEGPYNSVSRLAFSDDGKVGYLARDLKDKWFAVIGDKKTPLRTEYQEIGRVVVNHKKIVFAGMPKKRNSWSIASNNKILVEVLPRPPFFIIRKNGDIAYVKDTNEGIRYITGRYESDSFSQIEQLIEDGQENLFAKVKNKFGLWMVVSGKLESSYYVWMSDLFLDKEGNVFFLGVNSDGDLEFFKFHNK